jgi:hypothetical protein
MMLANVGGACVPANFNAWCDYGRFYLRPHEIAELGLVPVVLGSSLRRAGYSIASCVAMCMRQLLGNESTSMGVALAECSLGYAPDPEFCDLWRAPAEVWDDGGGDCDDLALFAGSLALACGLDNTWLVIGTWNGQGHAWIEGWEDGHFFHIEATSGVLSLCRPDGYVPSVHVSPLHGCVFSSRAA